jgi:photoactive yellow protein
MLELMPVVFQQTDMHAALEAQDDEELDGLDFGVIGFDADGLVRRYNALESRLGGFSRERILNTHIFDAVAPCFNNYLVAGRFDSAREESTVLDDTIDYVLTLKMRPVRVRLRLLASPNHALSYVLVQRLA